MALRKELDEGGLDAGAATIQWHLGRRGTKPVPVGGHHLADPGAARLRGARSLRSDPVTSFRRFEASAPQRAVAGRCHQVDHRHRPRWRSSTSSTTTPGSSPGAGRSRWPPRRTPGRPSAPPWRPGDCPPGHLSDNGLNFSGRLRGFEVAFEANLRAVGVRPITSRPFHPQTCGKIERFHQTLKRRLRRLADGRRPGRAAGPARCLRRLLQRRAARIGASAGSTPLERWKATPAAVCHRRRPARARQGGQSRRRRHGAIAGPALDHPCRCRPTPDTAPG